MKYVILALVFVSSIASATEIVPLHFGIQYTEQPGPDKPMTSFYFTIAGKDFRFTNFSFIEARVVARNNALLMAPLKIYSKTVGQGIGASETLVFAANGDEAKAVIADMHDASIVFDSDIGNLFSISIGNLCVSNASSFLNLTRMSAGCP